MDDKADRPRYPGLQIGEHTRQQEREWAIQRVSWVFLYALLIAILLGGLGRGPLSHARLQDADSGFGMEYERFMRHRSPDMLLVTARPASGTLRLRMANRYLQEVRLESIVPEPQESVSEPGATVFVFSTAAAGPVQIEFHIRPQKIGTIEGWIAQDGRPWQDFRQFVWP